jgi:hypothetical protein
MGKIKKQNLAMERRNSQKEKNVVGGIAIFEIS